MKLLLDENIAPKAKQLLEQFGHDVESIFSLSQRGLDDPAIFSLAQQHSRVLITHNGKHFVVLVPPRTPGIKHSGMLWLKIQLTRINATVMCPEMDTFFQSQSNLDNQIWEFFKDASGKFRFSKRA